MLIGIPQRLWQPFTNLPSYLNLVKSSYLIPTLVLTGLNPDFPIWITVTFTRNCRYHSIRLNRSWWLYYLIRWPSVRIECVSVISTCSSWKPGIGNMWLIPHWCLDAELLHRAPECASGAHRGTGGGRGRIFRRRGGSLSVEPLGLEPAARSQAKDEYEAAENGRDSLRSHHSGCRLSHSLKASPPQNRFN